MELEDELRQQQAVAPRILRDQLVEVAADIDHDVDADDVICPARVTSQPAIQDASTAAHFEDRLPRS